MNVGNCRNELGVGGMQILPFRQVVQTVPERGGHFMHLPGRTVGIGSAAIPSMDQFH